MSNCKKNKPCKNWIYNAKLRNLFGDGGNTPPPPADLIVTIGGDAINLIGQPSNFLTKIQ